MKSIKWNTKWNSQFLLIFLSAIVRWLLSGISFTYIISKWANIYCNEGKAYNYTRWWMIHDLYHFILTRTFLCEMFYLESGVFKLWIIKFMHKNTQNWSQHGPIFYLINLKDKQSFLMRILLEIPFSIQNIVLIYANVLITLQILLQISW